VAGAQLALAVPDDAMAGAASGDAPELLDVDVHELARTAALVAVGRLGRLERERFPSPTRFSQADTVESASPSTSAICAAVMRNLRRLVIASTVAAESWPGQRRGRDERSRRPGSPSSRQRRSQRQTVRSVTPAASAAAATDQPRSRTLSTSSLLLFGQVRALTWSCIRCPPWD
jgi:hypothetical protein